MRKPWRVLLILAVLGLGVASGAVASVPKVIFADDFGYAT
jgi:hypothetical protein